MVGVLPDKYFCWSLLFLLLLSVFGDSSAAPPDRPAEVSEALLQNSTSVQTAAAHNPPIYKLVVSVQCSEPGGECVACLPMRFIQRTSKLNNVGHIASGSDGDLSVICGQDIYIGPLPSDLDGDFFKEAREVGKRLYGKFKHIFLDPTGCFV